MGALQLTNSLLRTYNFGTPGRAIQLAKVFSTATLPAASTAKNTG